MRVDWGIILKRGVMVGFGWMLGLEGFGLGFILDWVGDNNTRSGLVCMVLISQGPFCNLWDFEGLKLTYFQRYHKDH